MKFCLKCKVEITKANEKKHCGYIKKICKSCANKETKKYAKRKSDRLKEWRKYYE